jgi:hypothetical protein
MVSNRVCGLISIAMCISTWYVLIIEPDIQWILYYHSIGISYQNSSDRLHR